MKNAVYFEIKQTLNTRNMLAVISIVILALLSSVDMLLSLFPITSLQPDGYHTYFTVSTLGSNTLAPFVPIYAAIPYATCYIDDIKSKYVRFYLIRTKYIMYIINRILVCFLSGYLIIFIGDILVWGMFTLLLMPLEKAGESSRQAAFLLLRTCMLMSMNGGLWAVIGMTMSAFMESKYIAYASPFIIYYLLVILCERYFPNAILLYPPNWTKPDVWPFGTLGAVLFLLELTTICGIVFIMRAGKRLREL